MHSKSIKKSECIIVKPAIPSTTLAQDIYRNFRYPPRRLSPKYLYDEQGLRLFEEICDTEEYYLTRVEEQLLNDSADEIIALARPQHIVEFGSGMSRKTRILLDACERQGIYSTYWPMDICAEVLQEVTQSLRQSYPWLDIYPLVGDYHAGLGNIQLPQGRILALFFGSTIGNMALGEAVDFLLEIQRLLNNDDNLLLGADRVKSGAVLEAAYDDIKGITRQFSFNVFNVLNRGLDANFDKENFSYRAIYNAKKERVEMYLISKLQHRVHLRDLNLQIDFDKGEPVLTEVSQKFTREMLHRLLTASSCEIVRHFVPDNEYFSLLLARFNKKVSD